MNIIKRERKIDLFGNLKAGDTFIFGVATFIKIKESQKTSFNAFCIEENTLFCFNDDSEVEIINLECREV